MHIFHSTTRRIIFFTLIAVLLLAVSGSIALAASNGLEPTKDLFTPSLSQGSLYPTAEQDMPRYVDVNLSLLDNAVQGDALGLNLYADVYFTAILQRKEVTQPDGYAWVGYLQGVEFSQVILVVGGGQMAGNITSPLGQYQVRYAGDGLHAIYTVDQSTFPPELPPIPVDAEVVAQLNQPEAPDLCTAIDVMVVWTPNARSAAGGTHRAPAAPGPGCG